ncbi:ABC transporter [Streptantibioticus ferralitis]|uniref:ABC transporter n=1 Tax=Streptantibioticus ferralitis TaxID=236510 RepID=A0ABT5Z4F5_9ACTN|nr:ABC transporter [Streptantibioticus ferralitis]MDF2258711.1 ABC transporter [Streptantibioticus ferralitis]
MTALLRYQAALLLRSQRWLPPLLLYGVIIGIGIQSGQPVLDSLGVTAAAILPVSGWLVRVCATGEPPAARAITQAAAGPTRVQLACTVTAFTASAVLGAVGSLIVAAISDPQTDNHTLRVPMGPAVAAGLLATLACALLGTAVGALCNPPVLRRPGWPIPVTALAALLLLVASGSPANAAVSGLVSGSSTGAVHLPVLPLALAVVACAAATAFSCRLAARR